MAMENFYKIVGAVLAPFRYVQREIENAKENLKEEAHDAAANALKIVQWYFAHYFFCFSVV